MTSPSCITRIHARQILDSRGRPTVEVDIELADGSTGRACAPSGASTGRHEAWELRDGDQARFEGRSVFQAIDNVRTEIARALSGADAMAQKRIDHRLIDLDGTDGLRRLGANAVVATSLAVCRSAASHARIPLYRHIAALAGTACPTMPMPMVNILSGGAHAGRSMDLQDFLAVPVGAQSYSEALDMVGRVRSAAATVMAEAGQSVLLADEGGLSPGFDRAETALDLMMAAISRAELRPGSDIAIALDVAASELFADGLYELKGEKRRLDGGDLVALLADIVGRYPVISVEDPLDQDDWDHWRQATLAMPGVQVLGDDLFVTNPKRIASGIERGVANAVLIKVNQNGTLTGTLEAMAAARAAGYATVVSARSGETEDPFIADLAVGTGAGQIKIGSVRNSDRLAKYNQLLRIEEDPGIAFAGTSGIAGQTVRAAA
ncbi:phosphopyruvate hydratase [Lichenicoccus sp.]|uniref:phosphopyruvate hydratase n=1 Tax=Lichenicoccus sp. TaxID=2781899 RepID=UPI003D0DA588